MKLTMTYRELLDSGNFGNICQELGINEWCVNEGLVSDTDEISIPIDIALRYHLIKSPEDSNERWD